jgi:hypothetical protein
VLHDVGRERHGDTSERPSILTREDAHPNEIPAIEHGTELSLILCLDSKDRGTRDHVEKLWPAFEKRQRGKATGHDQWLIRATTCREPHE